MTAVILSLIQNKYEIQEKFAKPVRLNNTEYPLTQFAFRVLMLTQFYNII